RACARGRSGPGCRRDRTGWRRTASEWLPPGVALVQAVPVANLALTILPAEVDLAPVAQVQEVDEAQAEVLGHAAQLGDRAEPTLHLGGQALDPVLVGPPRPAVEDAPAGQIDPALLGL